MLESTTAHFDAQWLLNNCYTEGISGNEASTTSEVRPLMTAMQSRPQADAAGREHVSCVFCYCTEFVLSNNKLKKKLLNTIHT